MNDINKELLLLAGMWLGGFLLGLSVSWESDTDIKLKRHNQQVNQCLKVVGGAVYDTPTAERTFEWCMKKYK
jgi:hypothetical protein